MATTIGTLIIDMAANVAKLQADMNAARGLVTNAAESMVSVAKTATAALGAIGVGLSFGAVVGEFKKAIDTMAELDDAAEMVGASVENVSRLMGVAAESGKSLSDVVAITAKLQSAMIGAEQDTGRASAAFKALGLNLSEFDDSTDALLAFARGLNQYEDGANKTQLAIAVLGKAGAQALPFLKDLANAGELQARVSAEQAAEAERYQKMMARSAYETEQFKISIAANLVPEIFKLIDQFKMARAAGLGLLDALNTIPFAMSKVAQVAESEKRIKALREEMEGLGKVRLFFDPGAEERLASQLAKEEKRRDVLYAQARAQGEFRTQAEELYGPNGYGERAAKMQAPALADEKKLRDASDAQKKLNDALFEAVGLSKDYYEKLGLMYQLYQSGKLNVDQYRAAVTELTNSQKFHKEAVDKAKEAEKDANAVLAELSKGKLAGAAATTKQIEESDKNLARIIEENSKIGLTREQLVDLNAERELAKARVIDQQIEEKMLVGDLGDEYDALRRVRQGYLDAAEEVRRGGRLQAISEEAKKSKDAWDKQATDIGNSLTDALMRGFESGKDFGKNMADTLKNLFKTLILKPIIQPIAQNLSGSLMSLLGQWRRLRRGPSF
jgi:polyhydroxyalkanoate synthesis regulator phasin